MKRIVLIILTFFSVFLFSCDEEEICCKTEPSWISNHLISSYIIPDSMEIFIQEEGENVFFEISVLGENVYSGECPFFNDIPHPLFDSISRLYNDTQWYGKSDYLSKTIAYRIESISIVSDVDFDLKYLAGYNLIDKAVVCAYSWGDFVLNGYPIGQEHLIYISKPFANYTKAERSLWDHGGCRIKFPYPEQAGTYNFTITVTFEGGKTLTQTIEAELPSASSITPPIRSDLDDSMRREGI